ncbi:MAG: MBL fold metallo-hydrolase [Lachnospiraceae bacterium]|nr:MBL fold metallo-hydrolase [Lachnospiraceae bacterium]
MNLCSIASGSSGNCIYVGNNDSHVIIDAGISGKRIEAGLNGIGLKTSEMNGILITHEHSDHIGGLGVLSRRYELPIYATGKTIEAIKKSKTVGDIPDDLFHEIVEDERFNICDLNIHPIKISHDAAQPVAYRFYSENKSVAVMTDLGKYDDYIINSLQDCDALLLEANHDINMLQVGRYPYYLKQRILGDRGHLSNESSGRLLCKLLHDNLKQIVLGHLSAENNLAELAYETVRLEITMDERKYKFGDFNMSVAKRSERSDIIYV